MVYYPQVLGFCCINQWIDSFEHSTRLRLPNRCKSYRSLKNRHAGGKDYSHAVKVWNMFDNEWSSWSLFKTDVPFLGNIFEKFIVVIYYFWKFKVFLEYYELDPFNSFSSSWLTWDDWFNYKIEIKY